MPTTTVYTLVRHTGYSQGGDESFRTAVETRGHINAGQAKKITAAGGVVFDSYTEASAREESENYPPGVEGITPQARGTFVSLRANIGEEVYIPVTPAEPEPLTFRVQVEQVTTCWTEVEAASAEEALEVVNIGEYSDGNTRVDSQRVRIYDGDNILIDSKDLP